MLYTFDPHGFGKSESNRWKKMQGINRVTWLRRGEGATKGKFFNEIMRLLEQNQELSKPHPNLF